MPFGSYQQINRKRASRGRRGRRPSTGRSLRGISGNIPITNFSMRRRLDYTLVGAHIKKHQLEERHSDMRHRLFVDSVQSRLTGCAHRFMLFAFAERLDHLPDFGTANRSPSRFHSDPQGTRYVRKPDDSTCLPAQIQLVKAVQSLPFHILIAGDSEPVLQPILGGKRSAWEIDSGDAAGVPQRNIKPKSDTRRTQDNTIFEAMGFNKVHRTSE